MEHVNEDQYVPHRAFSDSDFSLLAGAKPKRGLYKTNGMKVRVIKRWRWLI